jgi:glycine cleavage system aminomethyltransferase T
VFGDAILDLAYYHWIYASVNGIDVVISRTGFSSEVGFEVYLPGYDRGNELWEIIMEAGKPMGLSQGSPNRIRRSEGGVLDFGADTLPSNNPVEPGMARLISTDKDDYIGKAAIDRIIAAGSPRMMKGAFIDGEAFHKNNEHRWRVYDGKQFAGEVTSAIYSPRLARNIDFILADIAYAENGIRLEVDTPEGRRELELTDLPFLDKDKAIPRRSLRD